MLPPPTMVLPLPFFIPIPVPIPLLVPVPENKFPKMQTVQKSDSPRPASTPNDVHEAMSDCSSNNEDIVVDEQRRRRRALIIDKPSHTER